MIRPIPLTHGIGFCSLQQLPEYAESYREEQVGLYWNYHFVPQDVDSNKAGFRWPESIRRPKGKIDGFSPNLNKHLHVGHLRQLALANALDKMTDCNFVSLFGASQGVYKYAQDELKEWFYFLGFCPSPYYDVLMPLEQDIVVRRKTMKENPDGTMSSVLVWDGPKGEVIVTRNDGRNTYAFHDIAFAKTIAPDYYITGAEQKDHFESLGLGDKHLPMGLVLGPDGKKIKSRDGFVVTANEILEQITGRLKETSEPKKLAWNVLTWNFLRVSRSKNVQYRLEDWTDPNSPGLYITYTHARIKKALGEYPGLGFPDADSKFEPIDTKLLGHAAYFNHYYQKSIDSFDPAPLADYTLELAKILGNAYHAEKIVDGRPHFREAVRKANHILSESMYSLGMFQIDNV